MKIKLNILPLIFFSLLLFNSCSSCFKVYEQNFIYKGKNYVIRSSSQPGKSSLGNQLIGNDFVAVDIDQDRIIDKISKGKTTIAEAQEIYDYCLNLLESSGKLKEIKNSQKEYYTKIDNNTFVIKCFNCKGEQPFTEFNITNTKTGKNDTNIYIDKNSDLTLDEILKGKIPLSVAQKEYKKVIDKGIKQKKLKIKNGYLIVK